MKRPQRKRNIKTAIGLIFTLFSSTAHAEGLQCNFVQRCDDIGNECELSAMRLSIQTDELAQAITAKNGTRHLLNVKDDGDGTLLTVATNGQAKLTMHRSVGDNEESAVTTFSGVCRTGD